MGESGKASLIFTIAAIAEHQMSGYRCLKHVPADEGKFELALLEFVQRDEGVDCDEMLRRGREKGAQTGLKHYEAVLREQDKIPVEMRDFCLVFTEVWEETGIFGLPIIFAIRWNAQNQKWIPGILGDGRCYDSRYRIVDAHQVQLAT